MLLRFGGQTAAAQAVAAPRPACARPPTRPPPPTTRAPSARRRRARARAPAPRAGNSGGLPPDATVEDLLAALGSLSGASGTDSDGDFAPAPPGQGEGARERVVLPCGTVDYYALLQVDDDAPPRAVKRAYRGLARECHPDYR